MKLKYAILIISIAVAAFFLYQDDKMRGELIGSIYQVAPELNNSTLYKWKNNKGEWQITDTPPKKGIKFTTISTQDQVNVIASPTDKKKK